MEELKIQYRDYYWKYGVSPFKEDHPLLRQQKLEQGCAVESGEVESGSVNIEVIGENNNVNGNNAISNYMGDLDLKNNHRCLFVGCKLKAMALNSFCHLHILSDAKQKLYKPCGYVIKSAQSGPITCGKPILRSTVPSLCTVHFQKAQKHVTRALKKAGLNVSSSSKLAPKFHVIVAEYPPALVTPGATNKVQEFSQDCFGTINDIVSIQCHDVPAGDFEFDYAC
ncbi:hypothetical protein GH714_010447 [Hevea brasiliensis]|uniref:KAT8 regulatory NSL complex subunit 2 n=1 Tax=Hevea brasiliensis TaxID=3981 RepID=A0A6A6LFH3_HEVBR|nr:hypothetical protein GH714_010447 [Hevea brasiliensis]